MAKPMSTGLTWSDFDEFRTLRTTTDKLAELLGELNFHGTLVRNDDVDSDDDWGYAYLHVLQVTFTGGRDWVVIVGLEPAQRDNDPAVAP